MIEKTVKIGDKDIKLKTSGALGVIYRAEFKSDLLIDMSKVEESAIRHENVVQPDTFYIIEQFAFACAKHADPTLTSFAAWLEQFGVFDITNALPEIMKIWNDETASLSVLKKTAEQ